ncbi:hypothetical protein E2C01_034203 [Portunus trituberculatus]|uniref:Uncharacterized protein n=1 Tax=Portunus trituberculatus TaxID=210409 RepID=A0A5B7F0U7_PORTR|nr:hypothetical protein [Portunus trituberculatus]
MYLSRRVKRYLNFMRSFSFCGMTDSVVSVLPRNSSRNSAASNGDVDVAEDDLEVRAVGFGDAVLHVVELSLAPDEVGLQQLIPLAVVRIIGVVQPVGGRVTCVFQATAHQCLTVQTNSARVVSVCHVQM